MCIRDSSGSNYEVPPILLFQGGGGEGAFAETIIEQGSGKVIGIKNLQGGNNYVQVPTVIAVHPLDLERKERNRIISDSNVLANAYLTQTMTTSSTTINLTKVWYDVSQKYGFPDEGEVLIPFYNVTEGHWSAERILYGAKSVGTPGTLTVATSGRGYLGTTPHAHTPLSGTWTSTGTSCSVTTAGTHYLTTNMYQYLNFTSGTTNHSLDGSYKITRTGTATFNVELPYSFSGSGNLNILPEVRLRSL